ncbi:hypothetical protein [Lysinibacillus sp. 2017]|nr:hypothetical protein [Lysinibacillus sp. 2017]
MAGRQANVYTIGVQWLPEYQTPIFGAQPDCILKSVMDFNRLFKEGAL